jgi:primosomal protein N' (replication factor Y)
LTLSKRINDRPLPKVSVVDMNSEAKGRGTLSSKLREKIKETLADGKQVVLFINRRGFFTGMMCRECRHIVKCPKCSVPLTLHFEVQKLKCGHCGFSSSSKIVCPNCQSSSIFYFGAGTQRIESEVKEIFPQARIARIDRDTGAKRGSHEALFSSFKEGKANVLIGTQMVTKGLDVENVTLVGVVDADTALNSPDFRAAERTFELIEQVAGRAGRHAHAGEVVIQTFNPDHYAIKCAANHDYETFFNEEIRSRSELCYPPFSRLVNLIISGAKELNVKDAAQKIKGLIEKKLKGGEEVLGPAIAPVEKKRGDFRWQVLLKGKDISSIRKTVVESLAEVVSLSGIRTSVDVDPISML